MHLSVEKQKNLILNEKSTYLSDCDEIRSIYYRKREVENFKIWFKVSEDTFK